MCNVDYKILTALHCRKENGRDRLGGWMDGLLKDLVSTVLYIVTFSL
jgi:hypothetical protein